MPTNEYVQKLRHDTKEANKFFAKKLAYTLGPVELGEMLEQNKVKLLDVRKKTDYEESHIPQATNIEYAQLKESLHMLSRSDIHVVCCYNQQCHLGARAAFVLTENGFATMELEGGFKVWKEDFKFPTV